MDSKEQKNGGLPAEEAAQEEDGTLPPRGGNLPQRPDAQPSDAQPSDGQAYGGTEAVSSASVSRCCSAARRCWSSSRSS